MTPQTQLIKAFIKICDSVQTDCESCAMAECCCEISPDPPFEWCDRDIDEYVRKDKVKC